MKYLLQGLSIVTMLNQVSIYAMDDDRLIQWAQTMEAVADELPKLAEEISLSLAGSLFSVDGTTLNTPTEMIVLSATLKATACEMRAIQKIPVIEQAIVTKVKERFEWEIKFLRPGCTFEGGKDRIYIKNHLQQLFQNGQNISQEETPYIPRLIDHMLHNRTLAEGAKIALDRAKITSKFYEQTLLGDIITSCLQQHSQNNDDIILKRIKARGCHHFVVLAAYQWMQEQKNDDDVSSGQQEQSSKRVIKKRTFDGDDGDSKK